MSHHHEGTVHMQTTKMQNSLPICTVWSWSLSFTTLLFNLKFKDTRAASWQNQQNDVHPAKTQISMGIRPVWSESSLCAQWVAKDPNFLHADSKDSDQTGRMPRLIWVFTWRTCHFVGFVMRWLTCFFSQLSLFSLFCCMIYFRRKITS